MVVNCIQEQWSPIDLALQCTGPIHYKKNGWGFYFLGFFFFLSFSVGFFVFPSQIRTALLLPACLVQSTEHSTAGPHFAQFQPGNGKELGNSVAGTSSTPSSLGQGCWSNPSTEQALSRGFLESVDDSPCRQCPHHCCLSSSSSSSPPSWHWCQHSLSAHGEHPPSGACLGVPRKLQPSLRGPGHLGLSLG